jgi:hypothetical protein
MAARKRHESSPSIQVPLPKIECRERSIPVPLTLIARDLPGIASIAPERFSFRRKRKNLPLGARHSSGASWSSG